MHYIFEIGINNKKHYYINVLKNGEKIIHVDNLLKKENIYEEIRKIRKVHNIDKYITQE